VLATGVSENVDILYNSRDRGSISKVEGHWPKGALLYMTKIKRFYVVHEPNENLCNLYHYYELVFTKTFESIGLIPPELQRLEK
jgi:hypothetical protein